MSNPFDQINSRFNILEGLVHKILNRMDQPDPHERMTRKSVAESYHVSIGTVHNAMRNGDLPYSKIGRRVIIKRSDAEKWASIRT
jgi:hypothetical protein